MKVIYNSDVAVLDFLADLQDPNAIRNLQQLVDELAGRSGTLLLNCPLDGLVVLILHKSPFGFNDDGNNLILYADNTLRGLIKYFKNQLDHTSEDHGDIYRALDDITRQLYFSWCNEEDNNTHLNDMG